MNTSTSRILSLALVASLAACAGPRLHDRTQTAFSPRGAPVSVIDEQIAQPLRGKCIVVDPGHGGKDPGASAVDGSREKDYNLTIARLVAQQLREAGATVVMTRSSDKFISLDDRAEMADRHRCDLFISIHADAASNPSARGATVYHARGALAASNHCGEELLGALHQAGFAHRGLREAGFRVLMGHSRPSLLLECGFLTNTSDAANLSNPDWRARISNAVCSGVIAALQS
jgi:N-acetylmuramoyl-L-alanine amidase